MNNSINQSFDAFELILTKSSLSNLEIRQIESAWGKSEEKFCFYNGVFIGMLYDKYYLSQPYFNQFKLLSKSEYLLILTSETDLKELSENLLQFLEESKNWILIFEKQFDLIPIKKLKPNLDELKSILYKVDKFEPHITNFIMRTD